MGRAAPVRMGLLDWMLDAPYAPPLEQLCRSEGWDCVLRLSDDAAASMRDAGDSDIRKDTGPLASSATINVGLRFYSDGGAGAAMPGGSLSLVQPSSHFSEAPGSWEALGLTDDELPTPTAIKWRLRAGAEGVRDAGKRQVLPPDAELIGTFRLAADAGAAMLRDGELWYGELWLEGDVKGAVEGMRGFGTCDASPMPLMGSA